MSKQTTYRDTRNELLYQIASVLQQDQRIVAAWLTGGIGRGRYDSVSDIKLTVVPTSEAATSLCAHESHEMTDRYTLISQFGHPAILHLTLLANGTTTTVFYAETAIGVAWTFTPQTEAKRPYDSQLLFQKIDIPQEPIPIPETIPQRIQQASHQVSYFWVTAAVSVKYIIRRDTLQFNQWLGTLIRTVQDVERLVTGSMWVYRPEPLITLKLNTITQVRALRQICYTMLYFMPEVTRLGGQVPADPMSVIEARLALIDETRTL